MAAIAKTKGFKNLLTLFEGNYWTKDTNKKVTANYKKRKFFLFFFLYVLNEQLANGVFNCKLKMA